MWLHMNISIDQYVRIILFVFAIISLQFILVTISTHQFAQSSIGLRLLNCCCCCCCCLCNDNNNNYYYSNNNNNSNNNCRLVAASGKPCHLEPEPGSNHLCGCNPATGRASSCPFHLTVGSEFHFVGGRKLMSFATGLINPK